LKRIPLTASPPPGQWSSRRPLANYSDGQRGEAESPEKTTAFCSHIDMLSTRVSEEDQSHTSRSNQERAQKSPLSNIGPTIFC
jgi:hypothetical protein